MIEVYQIFRATERFYCSNGFTKERLNCCFDAFQADLQFRLKCEVTSWLFMSEESARDYCERHNTTLEGAMSAVGLSEVEFEYNMVLPNSVFD